MYCSANFNIDISERSTFCFLASSSSKSIGPSNESKRILNSSFFSVLRDLIQHSYL